MSSLKKNVSVNLFSSVWLTALQLLVTPLYIFLLGVEGYGLIGFQISCIAIIGILDTGISATATRQIAWLSAREGEKPEILSVMKSLEVAYWIIVIIIGVGFLVAIFLFGVEWFEAKSLTQDIIRDSMILMTLALIIQSPSGLYIGGLMGLQRQFECSGTLTLFGTIRSLGAVIVVWAIGPDIRLFFLWQLGVSAVQTLVMRWMVFRWIQGKGQSSKFSLDALRTVRGFAGGMVLVTALGVLISQSDKIMLSKLVSLEALGMYMVAWNVSSALSRLSTPLMQAYGPRFTELDSRGDMEKLKIEYRIASQLMNVLVLPPASLIWFLSYPILLAWLENEAIAYNTAPILSALMVGTVLTSCSYPSLSILYSRKQFRPVIVVQLLFLVVLIPLLIFAVVTYGVTGAALIWGLYGFTMYVVFQVIVIQSLKCAESILIIIGDFMKPCITSLAFAGITAQLLGEVDSRIEFGLLLGMAVTLGWIAALCACKDLYKTMVEGLK